MLTDCSLETYCGVVASGVLVINGPAIIGCILATNGPAATGCVLKITGAAANGGELRITGVAVTSGVLKITGLAANVGALIPGTNTGLLTESGMASGFGPIGWMLTANGNAPLPNDSGPIDSVLTSGCDCTPVATGEAVTD